MLWTGDFLRIAGMRLLHDVPDRPCKTSLQHGIRRRAVKAGVGIDPDRRAYHMFIKSGLTDDQINHIDGFVYEFEAAGPEQLWILERFRKLCSGSMTNLGTWIDTETPERPWAGSQDL